MKKNILIFGLLITALLVLFQLGKFQLFRGNINVEMIIAVVSILFFFLGLYFSKNWKNSRNNTVKQSINYLKLKELGISDREHEVLKALVNGLSNKEIGEQLFVAESTVKTHVSNLYSKLNVNRRPQAILKAQELHLVENSEIGTKVLPN